MKIVVFLSELLLLVYRVKQMDKLRFAGMFLLLALGCNSYADTEFEDSIPIEVVEILFDTFLSGQFAIYSDITDDFPEFELPNGFTVIGSVNQMNRLRVVLQTTLLSDLATQSITDAFENENWQIFPAFSPPVQNVGFVSPSPAVTSTATTLCHDQLGRLSINLAERDDGNYISIGIYNSFGNRQGNCAQQLAQQEMSMSRMAFSQGLREYMPRMEMPATANPRQQLGFIGGSSSSSNNLAETEANLNSDMEIDEVFSHFSDQIAEQDWELDSEAVGNLSANGYWTKSPEPDLNLIGMLSVLKTSDSNYELRFRIIGQGYTSNRALILRSTN